MSPKVPTIQHLIQRNEYLLEIVVRDTDAIAKWHWVKEMAPRELTTWMGVTRLWKERGICLVGSTTKKPEIWLVSDRKLGGGERL